MPTVITVLADGFEEIEAVTYIDLLRRADIKVVTLGLGAETVRGARDIFIKTDMPFEKFCAEKNFEFDAIVLPGGMPGTKNLAACEKLLALISAAFNAGKICAAICAAPTVLAKAGILDGKKATCYPGFENALGAAQVVSAPAVRDGNVITGQAVGSAVSFALELITALAGEDSTKKIAAAILV